ncbi:MAG: lytic transglycosylase domain-containing protein [Prevotella sp.]|nr:lytic transglycosylase domain-containing protein [Prevotella sp.]
MSKRIRTLLFSILLGSTCSTFAQIYEDDSEIEFTDDRGRHEKIEYPPSMNPMYNELDSLLATYHAMTYLSMNNDCEPASSNPSYDRQVYIERLQRMSTVIEMPYNDIVRRFIDRYAVRLRRQVSAMLGAANFYMPIFEEALESYGVPLELKYLPVIESALNPKAVSRAGATGLWQFMLATGKQYGLRVNSLVDDRRDPIRASYAAARYLRDLNRIFGDWTLALAAYNCGPENVNRAIRRSGGSRDYWRIYPYLPAETRGYVPAFIAANYIMTYYCDHNICPMSAVLPEKTDTIMVTRDVSMRQITQFCDIDINLLRELNPQYRRDIVNGASEPAILRMPLAACNKFAENEQAIYNYRRTDYLTHRPEVEVSESRSGSSSSSRRSYRSESTEQRSSSSESSSERSSERQTSDYGSSSSRSYSSGSSSRSGSSSSSRSGSSSSSRYGSGSSSSRYGSHDRSSSRYGRYHSESTDRHSRSQSTSSSHHGSHHAEAPATSSKGGKGGKQQQQAAAPAASPKGGKGGKQQQQAAAPAASPKGGKGGKQQQQAAAPATSSKGGKGGKQQQQAAAPAASSKSGKGGKQQQAAAPAASSKGGKGGKQQQAAAPAASSKGGKGGKQQQAAAPAAKGGAKSSGGKGKKK